jgi:hypothetical protein
MLVHAKDFQCLHQNYFKNDLDFVIFISYTIAPMCIFVGKCPTIWRFSTNYFRRMETNKSLNYQTSVGGCYNN